MPDERDAGECQPNSHEDAKPSSNLTAAIPASHSNEPNGYEVRSTSKEKKEPSKWGHNPDTWMVVLTTVLMVVGIMTAWIFYQQFQEMSKQTSILNNQAKQAAADSIEAAQRVERQIGIGQEQANASEDGVKVIRRQMRQDQRAWLNIEFGPISWAENQSIQVRMVLTNKGKTPAKNIVGRALVEKILINQKPHFGEHVQEFGTGFLPPNAPVSNWGFQSASEHIPLPMLKTDIGELDQGRAIAVVHGRITYFDIFGIEHWVNFCAYNAAIAFLASKAVQDTAEACTEYNDVDNN